MSIITIYRISTAVCTGVLLEAQLSLRTLFFSKLRKVLQVLSQVSEALGSIPDL